MSTPTSTRLDPQPSASTAEPAVSVLARTIDVVDRAAPQPARGGSSRRPFRVLPTTVWFPSPAPVGLAPLVVFAHGFDSRPQAYEPMLRRIAAAGFVIAVPLFPISASGLPGPPREDDMPSQALDLRAVITAMLAAARPGHWLAHTLDRTRVAVAGHSDGAETAAASVLVSSDHDPRIRAAVLFAGQVPTWGVVRPDHVPTLVVQGTADTVNPPHLSAQLYSALRPPKAYLTVVGGDHAGPVMRDDVRARTVQRVMIDFLDLELLQEPSALHALHRDGNLPGITRLWAQRL
jgi:predicted esterase